MIKDGFIEQWIPVENLSEGFVQCKDRMKSCFRKINLKMRRK